MEIIKRGDLSSPPLRTKINGGAGGSAKTLQKLQARSNKDLGEPTRTGEGGKKGDGEVNDEEDRRGRKKFSRQIGG